jgi:hypothetical protein
MSLINKYAKILKQILTGEYKIDKWIVPHGLMELSPEREGWFNVWKSNVIYQIHRLKKKNWSHPQAVEQNPTYIVVTNA